MECQLWGLSDVYVHFSCISIFHCLLFESRYKCVDHQLSNINFHCVGTAIGNGVYFAVDAEYSAGGFSPPDGSGNKHMYLSLVLTGQTTKGKQGMKAPPSRSGEILFDSVTDNPSNPSMFAVFHDAAAYPDYLIKFK